MPNKLFVGNGANTVPVHKIYKIIRLNARKRDTLAQGR